MWVDNLNPTLLHLGPLEIRWYGLVYVLGFFLTLYWLHRHQQKLGLTKDEVWDFVFYLMLGVLIGSRLFEIFWEPAYYLSNPLNLLKIWQGGMSFHGGFIGIITACWLYCRRKKLDFWQVADILSIPTMFALALGRIANFINGELVGRIWNGKWCVVFPQYDTLCRHPQVLYSAAARFLTVGWLFWLSLKQEFKAGFIFWNFVLFEGVSRLSIDFFREDPRWLGLLTPGQWFSLGMIIVSMIVFIKWYREDWKKLFGSK